jgi:hypothetical protein
VRRLSDIHPFSRGSDESNRVAALVSFLVLSGMSLASQSGEQRDPPSKMEEKSEKEGEHQRECLLHDP